MSSHPYFRQICAKASIIRPRLSRYIRGLDLDNIGQYHIQHSHFEYRISHTNQPSTHSKSTHQYCITHHDHTHKDLTMGCHSSKLHSDYDHVPPMRQSKSKHRYGGHHGGYTGAAYTGGGGGFFSGGDGGGGGGCGGGDGGGGGGGGGGC